MRRRDTRQLEGGWNPRATLNSEEVDEVQGKHQEGGVPPRECSSIGVGGRIDAAAAPRRCGLTNATCAQRWLRRACGVHRPLSPLVLQLYGRVYSVGTPAPAVPPLGSRFAVRRACGLPRRRLPLPSSLPGQRCIRCPQRQMARPVEKQICMPLGFPLTALATQSWSSATLVASTPFH